MLKLVYDLNFSVYLSASVQTRLIIRIVIFIDVTGYHYDIFTMIIKYVYRLRFIYRDTQNNTDTLRSMGKNRLPRILMILLYFKYIEMYLYDLDVLHDVYCIIWSEYHLSFIYKEHTK